MKSIASLILLLIVNMTVSLRAAPSVQINEIMASNTRAFPDITDFEDYPDWLELKNTTGSTISLDGYFLSDNPADPFKWQIPDGASIPANGFIIIIADGHDAAAGDTFPRDYWPWHSFVAEKYHANFSLSAAGESLSLSKATGIASVSLVNASTPAPVPPASVAIWKYKDNGADLSTQWRASNFDDSAWASGPAKLGYGDPAATTVSYGPNSGSKYITTYFRHHFTIADPAAYQSLSMKLLVDDGCVVYLNGTEIARRNMPEGDVNYRTLAAATVGGADETTFFNYNIPATGLVAGDNVLAVEVHQAASNSSDIGFDLGLSASSHTGYTPLDSVTFGQQVPDISYGRDSGDSSVWKQFAVPSPGAENTRPTVDDIRIPGNTVSVSLPGGLYASNQSVALSTAGGVIHYTLDGSNPVISSPVYAGPLNITATTVVRARCFETGKAPGPIVTRTYFRGETQTNVPYVSVVADPETLFGDTIGIYKNLHEPIDGSYGLHDVYKNKDAPGNIEFFGPAGSGGFSAGCGIRIGGENNWVHPQKALNIKIQGKYGDDNITYDLFPGSQVPVHTSFTLRDGGDNWSTDMLRDALFPKLAHGYLKADTSDYRPSIVFINGAYYGLHDVRERWDETWFAGHYHIQADKIEHLIYGHVTSSAITLGAQIGTTSNWLDLMNFLDTADLTRSTNWDYVESKIDMDSFMDFVIAESYGNNTSWSWNREFWREKNAGSKWHWFLPDMDRTLSTATGVLSDLLANEDVLRRLKANAGFRQRLAQRYAAHMAGTFKPSRVQAIISQMDAEVSALIPRHAARWAPNGTTVSKRNSSIQEMKDFANSRANNFYGEVTSDLGVGAAVDFTLGVNSSSEGGVLVQGVPVGASTFKMFPNIPFTLQAVPAPGYKFSSWTGATGGDTISVTITGVKTITANFVPSGETVIGGTLSADTTLTGGASPYALSSDLIVPAGVTLTVQPGVTIEMPVRGNIRVQGVMNIAGTAAQPVTIHGRNGARWGGISFEDPPAASALAHLIVRGATKGYDATIYNCGISGHNATATMDFLDVTDSECPIYFFGGSCTVRDSLLYSPYVGDTIHVKKGKAVIQRCTLPGNTAPDTDAVDFDGVIDGLIEGCRIYHFSGFNSDGLDMGEESKNILIQDNLIYYNADKGVSVGQGCTVILRRNLIVGCDLGVGIKDTGSTAIIDQNTFADCKTAGVAVYEKNFGAGGGSAFVTNTIISKTGVAPVTDDARSTLTVAYSMSDTLALPGSSNLLADPLFVDPTVLNFQLQAASPAINAGDPAHALDPDGTRADMGALYHYTTNDYPYTIGQTVVINEVLANSGTAPDWIELYNRTAAPVNIGGWFLSDDGGDLQKYRIPLTTIIPAHGYVVFYEDANFGAASVDTNKITAFALSDVGETVYLSSAINDQLTDYRTEESFGPSIEGESLGTYYKTSSDSYNFVAMKTPTPGAPNSAPRVGPIVISEIMYNPGGSGTGDAEYIELLNVSGSSVTLFDAVKGLPWRISDGIDFEFPNSPPLTMAAGERIVITKNKTLFNSTYGTLVPAGTKILEWGIGSLNNGGETLQLDRPGATDALNVVQYVREDRVNYDDAFPWPTAPDGTGPSLTRVFEQEYGNDFINWMAAPPSPGRAGNQPPADTDGDGIPDAYEIAHGLNFRDPTDAAQDADGDGQSNLAEYLAGTDPQIPDSLQIAIQIKAGVATVQFTAHAGQTYTVQYKETLADPTWLRLEDVPAQAGTVPVQLSDPQNADHSQRFYRIVTPRQP
jgi:hypothetical protein